MVQEGTPACAAGRSLQRHRWLRGQGSNPVLLVQSQAWCQFHHLASVWTGGLEPPTPGSRSRCAPIAPHPGGTDGRTRTDTDGGLERRASPVEAPMCQRCHCIGFRVPTPHPTPRSPCKGPLRSPSCATSSPWSRERGSNPPRKAYEASLIPDLPQCDGVTDRTRTGFLRGHIPACRPLQLRPQSTRRDSNLRHPLCERGGLPLTYSSVVGRRGVEPRSPAISARCRHRLAHAPERWWSQERSNLLLPGFNRPLHHQSFRTGAACGIEPAASRLVARASLSFRTSTGRVAGPARPVPGGTDLVAALRCPCS